MTTTIKALVNRYKIKADSKLVDRNPNMDDMPAGSNHFKVTLRGFGRQMSIHYSMGPALTGEPDAEGVLDCLLSDSDASDARCFEEWARDLGYDPDSRKAEKIYKACLESSAKLHKFLGDKFDAFYTAERG